MTPFALWRVRFGLALSVVIGGLCWSNSLTDHVGYGSALVTALSASLLAALTGAGVGARAKGSASSTTALLQAVGMGALYVALPILVVFARALVAPACGPGGGMLFVLLVSLPGAMLASLVGLWLGLTARRSRVATGLAAALVPAFIVWSLLRFYASPAVFAYDPFFGFFPGALYDEHVPLGMTLLSYRLGTLGWGTLFASLIAAGWHEGRWSPRAMRGRMGALTTGLVGLALGVGVYLGGPSLGHRHTADDIAARLGASAWSQRCVVRYDRSIDARQARWTARDCDVRLAQLEAFYGVRVPSRVTVFLFATSAQKASLMGAADTYIAKPWRHEVYLQYAPFPHPVLKHELAHVVAGAMASGPFQVTARGRWLPVPGLIEGAAVAAAWEGDGGDSSPHQWSRAMLEAGLAPRVSSLASLGFFAASSGTAYTAAGSFCRWLHDTRGAERFRRLYAAGDFEAVYGTSLVTLEREWHGFLRTVPTPERVLVRARTRFRRASIFGRTCPFALDDLSAEAAWQLSSGDLARARVSYETLVARDGTDLRARIGQGLVRVRAGDLTGADAIAVQAGRELGPAAETRVRTSIADAVWRWRSGAEAAARYAQIDADRLDEDEARTLLLKRATLAEGGAMAEAFRDLLIGRDELDPSPVVAMASLETERVARGDALAAYLSARQLFLHERFEGARARLGDEVLAQMSEPRVRAEALRMRATSAYHLGDLAGAARDFQRLADDVERPQGARDVAGDWLDRLRREGQ